MSRFREFRSRAGLFLGAFLLLLRLGDDAFAQERPAETEASPGQFFTIEQPIRSDGLDRLKAAARAVLRDEAADGREPVLLFDLQPGQSDFGPSYELADFIAQRLGGAKKTVAFIPKDLSGYAVLVALACDEIVMAPDATVGPITPIDEPVNRGLVDLVGSLARTKGRPPDLAVGLLDREADLRRVKTGDGRIDYVLAANLAEYRQFHQVVSDESAWAGGASRGVLSAERARLDGIVRQVAEDRASVAAAYGVDRTSADPTLEGGKVDAVWIKVEGIVGAAEESFIRRQVDEARQQGANLLLFQLDADGGSIRACDDLAQLIVGIESAKTVAYVKDRALGLPALLALACDEIIFAKEGTLGAIDASVERRGRVENLSPAQARAVGDRAAELARQNGYSPAVARALSQPEIDVVEALDRNSGGVVLISRDEVRAAPERFVEQALIKERGSALTVVAADAEQFGLSRNVVDDDDGMKELLGLRGQTIRINAATWVDSLVIVLNTPWMSGFLLFLGMFMLFMELKLPGIGLPAITATLAFLLFFWSRYLGGTADQLEIILFLVGLICLALELFVFPGFGVFGMSGVVLILVSVVMASHTFIWPTEGYQYAQMGRTLIQLVLALGGVLVGAMIVGRFLPSLPIFNRLILRPVSPEEELSAEVKPSFEGEMPLGFLMGESGRTTTTLRPSGKARFGEMLVDVTADGFFIERDSLVEVVEVVGSRVVVRKVG